MRRKALMIAIVAMAGMLTPMSAKAADSVNAKDVKKIVNNVITSSENVTAKAYVGSIKKDNYLCTMAVNSKKNITYVDFSNISGYTVYIKGSNQYVYDSATAKWNKLKARRSTYKVNLDIQTNDIKLLGQKRFRGKECYALQVKNQKTKSIYYVNKSNNDVLGIITNNGNRKVTTVIDTKSKVSIPDAVIKGKKIKTDAINQKIKVMAISKEGGDMKDTKISSYAQLKKVISKLKSKKSDSYDNLINKLSTYDSKYFKKSALYIKNYTNPYPVALYAVQKSVSKGKINIVLTQYFEQGFGYAAVCEPELIVIEADKNAAKTISNVRISTDDTNYIVPSLK